MGIEEKEWLVTAVLKQGYAVDVTFKGDVTQEQAIEMAKKYIHEKNLQPDFTHFENLEIAAIRAREIKR